MPAPHALVQSLKSRFIFALSLILCLSFFFSACNFTANDNTNDNNDASLSETRVALGVQQTLAAQQSLNAEATIAAQQATIQAQSAMGTAQAQQPPVVQATQPFIPVQETVPPQAPPINNPPEPTQANPPGPGFEDFKNSAQILLFEDIIADPAYTRYVKQTLDSMSLRYKDDGNAIGWLKNDLLAGSPTGQPWDVVIIANEARSDVSGEYYEYIMDVLNKGTSVILESWYLDTVSEGRISPILAKCGVQVYPYFPKSGDLTDVVMYPYQAAASHPIMTDPNRGLSFTKSLFTWVYTGDLGSLMAMTGKGDPIFLLGRNPKSEGRDAGLVSCINGRLTIQTFSSHSYSYNTIGPLWENYITNALHVRYLGR